MGKGDVHTYCGQDVEKAFPKKGRSGGSQKGCLCRLPLQYKKRLRKADKKRYKQNVVYSVLNFKMHKHVYGLFLKKNGSDTRCCFPPKD